jgi:hypothetical protein
VVVDALLDEAGAVVVVDPALGVLPKTRKFRLKVTLKAARKYRHPSKESVLFIGNNETLKSSLYFFLSLTF